MEINLKKVSSLSNVKLFSNGEVLSKDLQKETSGLILILKGEVFLYLNYGKEDQIVASVIKEGSIIDPSSSLSCENLIYVANGNVMTTVITQEISSNFISSNPDLIFELMRESSVIIEELVLLANKSALKKDEGINNIDESIQMPMSIKENSTFSGLEEIPFFTRPQVHINNTVPEKVPCPVCGKENYQLVVRGDKLTEPLISRNSRAFCGNFDKTWYEVMTCPDCYFSAFAEYYKKRDFFPSEPDDIKHLLTNLKEDLDADFKIGRDLRYAIIRYNIAISCMYEGKSYFPNPMMSIGSMCLKISWMLKDALSGNYGEVSAEDSEILKKNYIKALEKALKFYEKSYSHEDYSYGVGRDISNIISTLEGELAKL